MRFRISVSGLSFQIFQVWASRLFVSRRPRLVLSFGFGVYSLGGALGFQRLRVSGLGFDYVDAGSALSLHKGSSLNSGLFSDPFNKMENARGRGCCCKRFKVLTLKP